MPPPPPPATAPAARTYDELNAAAEAAARSTVQQRPVTGRPGRTHLFLSRHNVVSVTPALGHLTSLVLVDLSHNRLDRLDCVLTGLRRLRFLQLSHNQLVELPESIGALKALVALDVSHNELAGLPDTIAGLKALTHINLSHNRVRALPRAIGSLARLQVLRLDTNQLVALPIELARLRNLHTLSASHNPFLSRVHVVTSEHFTPYTAATVAAAAAFPMFAHRAGEPAVPALLDWAARAAHRTGPPASELADDLPPEIVSYLARRQTCSHCGGPFFSKPVLRYRFLRRGTHVLPFVYELCRPHWDSEIERVRSMFAVAPPPPSTAAAAARSGGGRASGSRSGVTPASSSGAAVSTVKPAVTTTSSATEVHRSTALTSWRQL